MPIVPLPSRALDCLRFSRKAAALLALAAYPLIPSTATGATEVMPKGDAAGVNTDQVFIDQRTPPPGSGGEPTARGTAPVVALLDFESETLDSQQEQALSQALWARMHKLGGISLMPRNATRGWLIRHDLHPMMPYLGQQVAPDRVLRALRADYLVLGHIDRIEQFFVVDYSIYTARSGLALRQDVQLRHATLEEMLLAFEGLAGEMRNAIAFDHFGSAAPGWGAGGGRSASQVAPAALLHKESAPGRKIRVSEASVMEAPPAEPAETVAQPQSLAPPATAPPAGEPSSAAESATAGGHKFYAPEEGASAEPPHAPSELIEEAGDSASEQQEQVVGTVEWVDEPEEQIAAPRTEIAPGSGATQEQGTEPTAALTSEPTPAPTAEPSVEVAVEPPHARAGESMEAAQAAPSGTPAPSPTPSNLKEEAARLYEMALALERGSKERLDMIAEATRLDPSNNVFHRMLANEYYSRKLNEQCVEVCNKGISIHPRDSMLHTIKASALFNMDKLPEAREANEAAIEADPENLWAHYNLGLTLSMMKSPDAAAAWRAYIDKAKNDPTHTDLKLVDDAQQRLEALEAGQ